MNEIQKIIESWLSSTNLSMAELSRRMGTNPQSVTKWRAGKILPNRRTVTKLINAMSEMNFTKEEKEAFINSYIDYKGKNLNTRSSLLQHIRALEKRIENLESKI